MTGTGRAPTASDWPIAAAMLQFPDATPERWAADLAEVADAGFGMVDITDSWVSPGDLSSEQRSEFAAAIRDAGLESRSLSVVRKSVIDAEHGEANLAYAHRTIEAAAELDLAVVCLGLHQPLTAEQRERLWFWTADGHVDPDDDGVRELAADRLRELGRHAEEVGILLSLELYEDTYLGTADSAVQLVERIGLDNVGINPDVGNLIRLHRPVESWLELYEKTLPYANYWHIKNYARDEDLARDLYFAVPAPLESGLIDYRKVIRLAMAAGFRGILCTEHYGGDGLSVSATNERYLRERVLPKSAPEAAASRVRQQMERRVG